MTWAIALLFSLFVTTACGGDDATTEPDGGVSTDAPTATRDGQPPTDGPVSMTDGEVPPPPVDGLPVGIPTPSFGWELDTDALDPTIWVDNTNPDCDDAVGTMEVPLCDLFRGGRSVTYAAGDVVHVLGGPYAVRSDYTLTMNGTADEPVVISGRSASRILFDGGGTRANYDWDGSFGMVENLDFFHQSRHVVRGDHLALRNVAVHNPAGSFIDFNPVVSVTGHDVLVSGSEIFHNRRSNDTDSHGIQASEGSFNVWILDNEIWDNNGDAFQGCHECFAAPPHHVYIGRNVMHEDRENAVDLKTIHDVVVSENVMWGYGSSTTSNGDAMVIGSNGWDESIGQGPRRVWVLHNEFRDSSTGIRVEASQDVWIVGNVFSTLQTGLQIDDKYHRTIVVAANTMSSIGSDGVNIWGCQPTTLAIVNNIVSGTGDRHLDVGECGAPAISIANNLFAGGAVSVRVDGSQHGDLASLHGESFATGNVTGDPAFEPSSFVPSAGSPAVNAGASLAAHYDAFVAAFGAPIDSDRAGTPRPSGSAEDIGAYERP
jgi:hypothetical protein